MNAKEILESIKTTFFAPAPAPAPAPAAPVVEAAAPVTTGIPYKLQDGTEISITQAGEIPAVGDAVSVGGAPAPEGVLTLEDGSTISVDASGVIAQVSAAPPVTNDLAQAPPVPTLEERIAAIESKLPAPVAMAAVPKTPEEINALRIAFANGTPEERIANLELVAKALMEQCFGWQIREAQQKAIADQAIEIYKTDISNAQAKMAKHEETITALFSLVTNLVEMPMTEPVTLTGAKKDQFEKANNKEKKFEKIAAALVKHKS